MNLAERVEEIFNARFHRQPMLVRSPGRVNLIGEHTDYNLGFVLPAAIDKAMYFAIAPRTDQVCHAVAVDMKEEYTFAIDNLQKTSAGWPNYLMGVVDQLMKAHYSLQGFDCVFGGDIPIGAGLSSSAALEAGLAFACNRMFQLKIDPLALVKAAQKAENEFVGLQCGIMDQYINIFGQPEQALRIDCRSLEFTYYPFHHPRVAIVLFNSCVSHSLASSEYNRRREECTEGVAMIKQLFPYIASLRDVSSEMLKECQSKMTPVIYRRCKYVVEENSRVLKACAALEKNDLTSFGVLMHQSHEGLSRDYEVSCTELDFLHSLVEHNPHVYGSRMMGGGFGGCTINLIDHEAIEATQRTVTEHYKRKFHIDLKTYITSIGAGTTLMHGQ
ncbi:MAG TPA: galactokinase [Bacteroidota bacterium]|nr:galactokinase [Bacteroidota bacterium]